MTATQLLVLIGALAAIRGVFLLRPSMQVRSLWLKLGLILSLGVIGWYLLQPETLERVPHNAKLAALIVSSLAVLFALPRGTLSESQKKTLLEYMDSIIIAGVTALVLIAYVVRSFYIPSGSMEKTLEVNDMILVNELVYGFPLRYEPARGDIIVFHPPDAAHSEGKDYIKRVIAVAGETIEVKDETVYINGKPLDEPYKHNDKHGIPMDDYPELQIPEGHVFVMGDNRRNSQDSRVWGPLPKKNIIGRAFVIFYPFQRVRILH